MKIFALAVVVAMGLSLALVSRQMASEETYAERLSKIAQEINGMNLSWKATEYKAHHAFTLAQAKRLNSLVITEPPAHWEVKKFTAEQELAAPASFDSRQQWPGCSSISLIRDQSDCGSCWAFGASEAMSDRICIGSNQVKQTLVSPENLMTCCYSCGNGCNGGQLHPSWEYWKNTGLVSGGLYGDTKTCQPYAFPPCAHHTASTTYPPCPSSEYPTPKCSHDCVPASGLVFKNDKSFGKSVYAVQGAKAMETEISTNGPIEAAFTVYEDFLTYTSGVYVHKSGKALGGHAIRILGYGTLNNQPYWLCANSWNETWGDNGYFKILKGVNECGIEGQGVAGLAQN